MAVISLNRVSALTIIQEDLRQSAEPLRQAIEDRLDTAACAALRGTARVKSNKAFRATTTI